MNFLFRADASGVIGTGHVMRCLAVAQALQDEGATAEFLCATIPDPLRKRLEQEGLAVYMLETEAYGTDDIRQTIDEAKWMGAPVVVDGYTFSASYQEGLKASGLQVLWIDDYGHGAPYGADFILNQNAYASEKTYRERDPSSVLLLGPSFVQLRREFREWRTWQRKTHVKGAHILLTLGGADPANVTGAILDALAALSGLRITVPIGSGNSHAADLEERAKRSPHDVRILRNIMDMTPLMAEADIAIAAGGTTSYELAFMQVPMLTMVLADNQRAVSQALAEAGCSIHLHDADTLDFNALPARVHALLEDEETRRNMSLKGRSLVDGEGTDRVLMHLLHRRLRLRPVQAEDSALLFAWANDPDIRAASVHGKEITPDEHRAWFERTLHNPKTLFLMAIDHEDQRIGSIRFEQKEGQVILSFSLGPLSRGKGLGGELVRLGSRAFLLRNPQEIIHAFVKPANERSAAIFRKTGYAELPPEEIEGHSLLHFSLDFSRIPA